MTGGKDPNGTMFDPDPDFLAEPNTGADCFRYEIENVGEVASVEVSLYSQSFMPSWFYEKFSLANYAKSQGLRTPEIDRLFYIASHLKTAGTAIENWKLKVSSDTKAVAE